MGRGWRGTVATVTRGSRGLGRTSALRLAVEGCNVAISARGQQDLGRTVANLRAKGVGAPGSILFPGA